MLVYNAQTNTKTSFMTPQRWGALASFLLAISFFIAPPIYLTGNLRDAMGVFSYQLADFLYGPVLAASLITVTYVLREYIGKQAKRRMDLALLVAVLAAVGIAAVAFIRASNRHYHLIHPELHLEDSATVLTVWTTLVAGVGGLGFHFLGWNFVLLGSAGWTSRLFPRILCILYFLIGIPLLFAYLTTDFEYSMVLPGPIISIWQAILLWRAKPTETQTSTT
jgi:hypothetical protein